MTDDSYVVAAALGELVEVISHRVVASRQGECPQECGEVGQVFYFVHADGGITVRCLGCRRDSFLDENFDWVYADLEYRVPLAVVTRW